MSGTHHDAAPWGIKPPAAPPPPREETFRIYRLIDPAVVASQRERLGRVLFGNALGADAIFQVHPVSGTLWFDAGRGLGGQLPDAGVERLARAWLDGARRRVAEDASLSRAGLRSIFPSELEPIWLGSAAGTNAGSLCRLGCRLPLTTATSARVDGAYLELRFDAGGDLAALVSRWRIPTGDLVSAALRSIPSAPDAETQGHPRVEVRVPWAPEPEQPAEFAYCLEDDAVPQRLLAPAVIRRDGHHAEMAPLSAHTLIVDILQRTEGATLALRSTVAGGSGDFAQKWTAWTALGEDPAVDLGTGPQVRLGFGAWAVGLDVIDRITGATGHHEILAYVGDASSWN